MKRCHFVIVWTICLLSLLGCSQFSQSSTPIATDVIIDGQANDWGKYLPIVQDYKDDQLGDTPDLSELRAFCNDKYLYLFIKLNKEGTTDHYDVLMNTNGDFIWDYQLSFWPEENIARFSKFPVTDGMDLVDGVTSAKGEIIEMKMPLSLIEGKKPQTLGVQTYDGTAVGDLAQGSVPATREVEPTDLSE